MTLPAVALLSLVGAGAGVHLGRSAIGEINPVYFHTPASPRFFADLAPEGYRPVAQTAAVDFWADNANVAGMPVCGHCSTNFVDALYTGEGPRAPSTTPAADPVPIEQPQPLVPREIDRYATYPVTQEEARRTPAAGDAGAVPEQPRAAGEVPEPDGI